MPGHLKHYAMVCLEHENGLTLRNILCIRNSDLECVPSTSHTGVQSLPSYASITCMGNETPARWGAAYPNHPANW